jgi:hypothetical protein
MTPPSLFHYATSELSQDAFLCWLLDWANPKYAAVDTGLHAAGKNFVTALLAKHGIQLTEGILLVKIERQCHGIDVYAVVNEKFGLLIEDKVHAEQHGEQLKRGFETIHLEGKHPCPIYLKTGNQSCFTEEEALGFKAYTRRELLAVLQSGVENGVKNAIYLDFYHHLSQMEQKTQAYKTTPLHSWKELPMVQGFYMELKEKYFPQAYWKYVSNQQGGLWVFTMEWQDDNNQPFCYLELEWNWGEGHKKPFILCYKLWVNGIDDDSKRMLRQEYHDRIFQAAEQAGFPLNKPKWGRLGKSMTILETADYRKADTSGLIDVGETAKFIQRALNVLSKTLENEACLTTPENVSAA